ncbi:MAG: isobutyryl-CoA mutase large subunit, partial [Pseudonocardiales bacterium]|nr:isobutyryl-CoA mutase large subunit [Pseudonocardiales bacterium]
MDPDHIAQGRARWQQRYDQMAAAGRIADRDFTTLSGSEVDPVYGPTDGLDGADGG